MHFEPHKVYHIYNRGNNKQPIFFNNDNYQLFYEKLIKTIKPYCEILGWCLMPNHFHFLVATTETSCSDKLGFAGKTMQVLPYRIGVLLSSYSQLMNKQNGTIGSLFQQKTKSKLIPDYIDIIRCLHYIHQNPVRAGLVNELDTWIHSSFGQYTGLSTGDLCNTDLLFELTGYKKSDFLNITSPVIEGTEQFY